MPIYVYRCDSCRGAQERVRPISERDELESCEKCSRTTRRLTTATDLVNFKGGGGTRKDLRKFPVVPLAERMNARYGDNA